MTNEQLYLAIGLPMLFNAALILMLSARLTSIETALNKRFDDMRDLWRAELRELRAELRGGDSRRAS